MFYFNADESAVLDPQALVGMTAQAADDLLAEHGYIDRLEFEC